MDRWMDGGWGWRGGRWAWVLASKIKISPNGLRIEPGMPLTFLDPMAPRFGRSDAMGAFRVRFGWNFEVSPNGLSDFSGIALPGEGYPSPPPRTFACRQPIHGLPVRYIFILFLFYFLFHFLFFILFYFYFFFIYLFIYLLLAARRVVLHVDAS